MTKFVNYFLYSRAVVVQDMTARVNETMGNGYIRLSEVALINEWYTYLMSFTVFTSSLKLCKLLSFHRSFKQVIGLTNIGF